MVFDSCFYFVSFLGPKLADYLTFGPPIAPSMKIEYSDRACTIEMVDSVTEAVNHINTFGSSHTDVIISDNEANIQYFLDVSSYISHFLRSIEVFCNILFSLFY